MNSACQSLTDHTPADQTGDFHVAIQDNNDAKLEEEDDEDDGNNSNNNYSFGNRRE